MHKLKRSSIHKTKTNQVITGYRIKSTKRKLKISRSGNKETKTRKFSFLKLLINLLLFCGICLLTLPLIYKKFQNLQIDNNVKSSIKSASNSANLNLINLEKSPITIDSSLLKLTLPKQPPLRIVIPILKIDLPIVEAKVVNGLWELSETTASHGVGSANPGENGNVVIFAHAREKLFLPLKNILKNDLIYVFTKDEWFRYRVDDIKNVLPTDTEVIKSSSDEILTLYTCSGFLDNKRLIVKAVPDRP
jgi:LPXTG-site transpeptidase (sortase) family protein